ncbi:uncharacterized protein LOC119609574 [Lucilia sericata]|uniref:uncharacterized protein LOC119609574 n=1 Tax=Lucilia sericata TaxID=13632 RepID=UPI0018A881A6|nr:uncharacterized protein LOC119609574 [Lucilia sericata]
MQNHTECHCVNRASLLLHDSMPRDKRSGGSGAAAGGLGSTSYLHHFQRQQRKQQQQQPQQEYRQSSSQLQSPNQHHQEQLQNMLDCHCPRHFNVFEEDVERHAHLPKPHSVFIRKCRCDCLVNNQTCLRFKHGEEGFPWKIANAYWNVIANRQFAHMVNIMYAWVVVPAIIDHIFYKQLEYS